MTTCDESPVPSSSSPPSLLDEARRLQCDILNFSTEQQGVTRRGRLREFADRVGKLGALVATLTAEREQHHDCVQQAIDDSVRIHDEIEARRDHMETLLQSTLERWQQAEAKMAALVDQRDNAETAMSHATMEWNRAGVRADKAEAALSTLRGTISEISNEIKEIANEMRNERDEYFRRQMSRFNTDRIKDWTDRLARLVQGDVTHAA